MGQCTWGEGSGPRTSVVSYFMWATLSSKLTCNLENLILHLSLFPSVGRTDLMALHRLLDLFTHRFFVF